MRKKYAFIKFYNNCNLGDDLFVHILCNRYKKTSFITVGSDKNKKNFDNIYNLVYKSYDTFIHKVINKILKILFKFDYLKHRVNMLEKRIILNCDIKIIISGSYFIEFDNNYFKPKYLFNKFHIIGINFGPYITNDFLQYHKDLFKLAEEICFRDSQSYNLFRELKNSRKATDIVFSLKYNNSNHFKSNKMIVISVMNVIKDELKIDYYKYLNLIADIIKNEKRNNNDILLISFCESSTQNDLMVINDIKKMLNIKVKYISYNGTNLNYIISAINNCYKIYATRYHAMILGMLFQKKVIPIIYSDKMKNVLLDMNYSCDYYDLNDFQKKQLNFDCNINIDNFVNLANENFKLLDKELL